MTSTQPPQGERDEYGPDPYGVRSLLSSAPPVGPMPPAVSDRIMASLAAEQRARAGSSPTVVPLAPADGQHGAAAVPDGRPQQAPGTDATQHPYVAHSPADAGQGDGGAPYPGPSGVSGMGSAARGPRRRSPGLALAAAAAGVLVVGGLTVTALNSRDSQDTSAGSAMRPAPSGPSSSSGAGAPNAGAEPSPSQLGDAAPGAGHSAKITTIRVAKAPVDVSSLATRAKALISGAPEALGPGQAESPVIGPLGTRQGVRSCLAGLRLSSSSEVRVELTTLHSHRVALIATKDASNRWSARVVHGDCSTAGGTTLIGPVSVR